jgi:CheY-like chemotaxis protein
VLLSDYKIILQTATSAQGALDIADWFKPDILISDLAMPGEDGYSLIGRLRARETENAGRPIQAVALTAYARTEDRERALSSGFNMFVAKPIDPDELISALSNLTRINQKG